MCESGHKMSLFKKVWENWSKYLRDFVPYEYGSAGATVCRGVNLQSKIMWNLKISGIQDNNLKLFFEKFEIQEWGGVEQGSLDVIKCNFLKSLSLTSHAQKMHLKYHNQVKVIQGHQVHFSKKCIFGLPYTKKAFYTSWTIKISMAGHQLP